MGVRASSILSNASLGCGMTVMGTRMPSVMQRSSSTVSCVRFSKASGIIAEGQDSGDSLDCQPLVFGSGAPSVFALRWAR